MRLPLTLTLSPQAGRGNSNAARWRRQSYWDDIDPTHAKAMFAKVRFNGINEFFSNLRLRPAMLAKVGAYFQSVDGRSYIVLHDAPKLHGMAMFKC